VTVCIGVLVLRKTRPDLERPFRDPRRVHLHCRSDHLWMDDAVPRIGTWARLLVWTIIGAIIYALYGYKHSRLHAQRCGAASECHALRS